MNAAPTIREAGSADIDTITRFNLLMAVESEGRELDQIRLREGVRKALEDRERGVYYLAEIGGDIAGQTLVTREWSDWRDGWFWWIQSVFVPPEHRRKGVFRALYSHIENAGRAAGDVCGLRLYVENANQVAIETYLQLGMVDSGYRFLEVDWSKSNDR